MNEGSYLNDIIPLVKVINGKASVSNTGTEIYISNPNLAYTIYGPFVTKVYSENKQEIQFTKIGDYIFISQIPTTQYPTVTLNSPVNEANVLYPNIDFVCTANSFGEGNLIQNITLYLNSGQGWNKIYFADRFNLINGNTLNYQTTLPIGEYYWNCLAYDSNNNPSFSNNNNFFKVIKRTTTKDIEIQELSPKFGLLDRIKSLCFKSKKMN